MQTHHVDARGLAQSGIEAMHRGDAAAARENFQRIIAAGLADGSIFFAMALACRALHDVPAALAAVDRTLELEPANLRALMFKADHFAAAGDARAASSFYRAALKHVPAPIPPDLREEANRAQAMCDRYAAQFENRLQEKMAALVGKSGSSAPASLRFNESLEILFGRKQVYFQQPQYYFFPSLPQIQFYERQDFPWLDKVEAATGALREELQEVMKDSSAFTPYVQGEANRPATEQGGMVNNPDWSAFYLWKNGEPVAENVARCPRTMAALEGAPIARVAKRSPSILFSLLRPGARIPAHTGFINTRLICHLPLIVPPRCGFRVGNDTREWVEGKAWLFDDTIEHEAWNLSEQTRVILLFEIWRPELTGEEQVLVSSMFEAIDSGGGTATPWSV